MPSNSVWGDSIVCLVVMALTVLAALFFLGWFYVYGSRFLGLLLGVFPTMSRPILPRRKIDAPKDANTTPATVRIIVPPLPPRQ